MSDRDPAEERTDSPSESPDTDEERTDPPSESPDTDEERTDPPSESPDTVGAGAGSAPDEGPIADVGSGGDGTSQSRSGGTDDPAAPAGAADVDDSPTTAPGNVGVDDAPGDPLDEFAAGDDPDAGNLFEEVDVGFESEDVWQLLEEDEVAASSAPPVPIEEAEVGEDGPGETEHVVDKREYCQRCRYLSAPPELRCEHGGTEIVEVVDADRFRVRNCPMVDLDADDAPPGDG